MNFKAEKAKGGKTAYTKEDFGDTKRAFERLS